MRGYPVKMGTQRFPKYYENRDLGPTYSYQASRGQTLLSMRIESGHVRLITTHSLIKLLVIVMKIKLINKIEQQFIIRLAMGRRYG